MIIDPNQVPQRTGTNYPELFKGPVAGRIKQRLGEFAGLKNFGVNLTRLKPGSCSALRHWHTKSDEFIYILEGEATLVTDSGENTLASGMMAAFRAGLADGHHLINRSEADVIYLEIGDRAPGDEVCYPDDDLQAATSGGPDRITFLHKNGTPY